MYKVPRIFTEAYTKGFPGFRLIRNPTKLVFPQYPSKTVSASRYTHRTIINGRTQKADKNTSPQDMQILVQAAEKIFFDDRTWELAALIGGMPVILRTNSPHLANFWGRNWWLTDPQEVRAAFAQYGIPFVTMRAVLEVPNPVPESCEALYCRERNETVFRNTDYYGQCKSWALGAAGALLAEYDVHSIHGACVSIDGPDFQDCGIMVIAPTGTGKSTYTNVLARIQELDSGFQGRINSDDWVYVHDGVATPSERFIYVRTNAVDDAVAEQDLSATMRKMRSIFDKTPCENVPCEKGKRLYSAVPNSRAMINPTAISKMSFATPITLVVLLRRDETSPFFEELDGAEAVAVLEQGQYMVQPGAGPKELWGTLQNEPWYNPYLLRPDVAFERRKFAELKEKHGARYVIFNTHPAVAPKEFGIQKPAEQISTFDIERTVEGTARIMLRLLQESQK